MRGEDSVGHHPLAISAQAGNHSLPFAMQESGLPDGLRQSAARSSAVNRSSQERPRTAVDS